MTQNTDFNRPFNNLVSYVPKALRNSMNTSVLDNLFNRFMSHDESIPLYGYIGKKPANINDKTPAVPQPSVERSINTIAPIISFNVGATKHLFTFQDLMNRAKALGISENLSWLYSQGNNFVPPINIDKFTNFYNYYWVPKSALGPVWNPTNAPEYYVIAPPPLDDKIKLNVKVATQNPIVLTGSGFKSQQFVVSFISSDMLEITSSSDNIGWTLSQSQFALSDSVLETHIEYKLINDVTGEIKILLSFDLVREYLFNINGEITSISKFDVSDQFIIDAPFISKNYSTKFSGSPGIKGKISNVKSLSEYQTVNGILLKDGDRILVKDNTDIQNGIWFVRPRDWVRTADFDTTTAVDGSLIYVEQGDEHNFSLWKSVKTANGSTFTRESGFNLSKTNDWQEHNFWAHISLLKANNINKSSVKQASRPIIEFSNSLELNEFILNGKPSDSGTLVRNNKIEFNQLPLFNLYRYDGTHSNKVSSIFFYQEDEKAALDVALQKRVKKSNNDSGDFIFSHGCHDDETGGILFFKDKNELCSIWKKGYSEPTLAHISFNGEGNGSFIKFTPTFNAQQQIWSFEAISNNVFKIKGSKTSELEERLEVGKIFKHGEFECELTASSIPFAIGDIFKIAIGNLERPRYVVKYANDEIKDFNGGFSNDLEKAGAYQVSRTFTNNPYNISSADIAEGTLYSHFRSILGNQISNKFDNAFGGNIKLWSEQHTLLASLLMQEDLTPSSMISFAQREYEQALNAIREIFSKTFLEYISNVNAPQNDKDISTLVDWLLEQRMHDHDVKTVLFDSTSPVKGFPPTLPMLGVLPLVTPKIEFDKSLNSVLLTHHDGHKSPIDVDTNAFRQTILGRYIDITILRSNGTFTPVIGSYSGVAPTKPFKGELWISPNGNEQTIFVFNVLSDNEQPLSAVDGDYYFDRQNDRLFLRYAGDWVNQPTNAAWKKLDIADILNRVNLEIEVRLANGINPASRKVDFSNMLINDDFNALLEKEFYSFAAFNKYDPLAPKFAVNDPFTWNYSQVSVFNSSAFTPAPGHGTPARWNQFLIAHQRAVFNAEERYTERPDLEPWKLLGYSTLDEWKAPAVSAQSPTIPWKTEYESPFRNFDKRRFFDGGTVKAVKTENASTVLSGEPIIDGVQINFNELILLTGENDQTKNGIWRVTPHSWTRGPRELTQYLLITVTDGIMHKNTQWALLNNVTTLESDDVIFEQVRSWSTSMWNDIKSGIGEIFKSSVNSVTDELLPPYVSVDNLQHVNALMAIIPSGISNSYNFGELGPVENIWRKTIDFGYSLARAFFKYDPISFLGFCWGYNWVTVNGISYDGDTLQMPAHKKFKLHGDAVVTRTRKLSNLRSINIASQVLTVTYDAYGVGGKQLFSIKENNKIIGLAIEGEVTTVKNNISELSFLIEDLGIPFNIGDTFNISVENNDISHDFVGAINHKIQGFGQIFTQALRNISIDNNSYAISAFRNWEVNMGYRASGLVATDDLKIRTDAETLSTNSFSLLFKKNKLAQTFWIQALRIQLVKTNKFTEDVNGLIYPVETGDDWTFRVEGFNPRHLDITYYDMALSETMTFNALSKENTDIEWLQPLTKIKTINTQLPLEIKGIQNVINFLFGYKNYLEDSGWEFNKRDKFNIDAETGRKRSFQLEIEKFVDSCFGGIKIGQGHIVNPFMDKIWLKHNKGLLSTFDDNSLFDISGHPGIYDVNGTRINAADIKAIRTNQISEVSSDVPMFSAQFQIDEFEHVFVFNNFAQPSTNSGLLYDPFSGAKVITYKINGRRQANFSMRPEFGGHYLVGNEVKQNLQASTDNVSNFYNTNTVFENEKTTNHALALLGFNNKKYFDDLDINNASQFNFWRGLVHSKGTYSSILAYLNNGRFDDAKIDEYWAYKVAEYGDARQKIKPELRLSVNDALQQFTKLQFDPNVGVWNKSVNKNGELPGFTIISSADENRWFSIDDMNHDTYFDAEIVGEFKKTLINNDVIKLPFIADKLDGTEEFDIINSTTLRSYLGGESHIVGYGPSASKYNPLKLFNYVDNELVADISLWNPAAGFHNPIALESINIISKFNPAKFNYSTQITDNVAFDPLRPWSDKELGRIWLDTTKLEYVPYYDEIIFPLLDDRLNRWGALAEYATVDVYEWVKSTVPPQEYNKKALTDAGNSEIDISIRAAGIVAAPETYKRSRDWGIYPVAWSYSPLLIEEGHPAFNSSFESAINMNDVQNDGSKPAELKLFLDGGVIWLESGSFADFGITAGMRIGAWDPDPEYPKPLSEMKITNTFFKKPFRDGIGNTGTGAIVERSTEGVPSTIKITIAENSPLRGRVLFSAHPITAIAQEDQDAPTWKIPVRLKVTEIDSGQSETISLNTEFGTEFDQPAVEARPSIPYLAAIPSQPAKPSHLAIIGLIQLSSSTSTGITPTNTVRLPDPNFVPDPANPGAPVPLIDAQQDKTYITQISIDGVEYAFEAKGSDVTTWGGIATTVNRGIGRPVASIEPVTFIDGGVKTTQNHFVIKGTSTTSGVASVRIITPGFFADVRGVRESHITQGAIGETPATPAQEAAPAIQGQAAFYTDAYHGAKLSVQSGQVLTYESDLFKMVIQVTVLETGVFDLGDIQKAIISTVGAEGSPIVFKDAVEVEIIVPLGIDERILQPNVLSNNTFDAEYEDNNGIGWRAWSVPSQEQLDNDGMQPNSAWKPYVGPLYSFVNGDATINFVKDAIEYLKKPLKLNDGTIVRRYETEWKEWKSLKDIKLSATNTNAVTTDIAFTHSELIDPARTSVYINGIAQLKASFEIDGKNLKVLKVKRGHEAVIIIRKYEPRDDEMLFNPASQENYLYQHQFKKDYEYVVHDERSSDNNLTNKIYYFWVKNRTIAPSGKRLSTQTITQELMTGPTTYLTFQNLLEATDTLPNRYTALVIAGLNFLVTKDNTFKLRFTRDFTLRDNPEDLNLKDTHTEWSLMREHQNSRIPLSLWNKMIDSAAGIDSAGNDIPSLRRILYDERNKTRTQFGFNNEQTLAPAQLLRSSILFTILNTKIVNTLVDKTQPDYINFLNFNESDMWFSDADSTRKTLSAIWLNAKTSQINEIFFAALNDMLACNYELSDIFKTSRLSAYSIKLVPIPAVSATYE